jgi:hypothetical protein
MSSEAFKRLGAVDVSSNTDTSLYTVPAATSTIISSMVVCNKNNSTISFRVAHVDGAVEDLAAEDYIYYEISISAYDSFEITRAITMSAEDTLVVRANTSNVNFIAWGSERT